MGYPHTHHPLKLLEERIYAQIDIAIAHSRSFQRPVCFAHAPNLMEPLNQSRR